jgi:hypothetical protein
MFGTKNRKHRNDRKHGNRIGYKRENIGMQNIGKRYEILFGKQE